MAALLESNPINLYPFLAVLTDGTVMMTAYNRTYLYGYASPYQLFNSTVNLTVPDLPHPVCLSLMHSSALCLPAARSLLL